MNAIDLIVVVVLLALVTLLFKWGYNVRYTAQRRMVATFNAMVAKRRNVGSVTIGSQKITLCTDPVQVAKLGMKSKDVSVKSIIDKIGNHLWVSILNAFCEDGCTCYLTKDNRYALVFDQCVVVIN